MDCEEFVDFKREIRGQLISIDESLRQMHGENNNIRKQLDAIKTQIDEMLGKAPVPQQPAPAKADPWERATHVCHNDETLKKQKWLKGGISKIARIDGNNVYYAEGLYGSGQDPKHLLTPLREVRTPGREKGEFVPYINPCKDFPTGLYTKLDHDEPDKVEYVECK